MSHPCGVVSLVRPVTDIERSQTPFKVVSDYAPSGDQPQAIEELVRRIDAGEHDVAVETDHAGLLLRASVPEGLRLETPAG